ncbi:LLM class flavin-dependent oxidoreductase [Nesterenkonia alba]|uniref:LLM class flavin-dependent oxidoreductase n=1 Tax=Nesterenkonia alba TaxID=515814 RepID=UPI0003B768FA|nr:LLM class flavin-dependent oxidoreductase [Nesterenkonia alba]
MTSRYLWYVPNQTVPGHRGDEIRPDHNSLETLTEHARAVERHGWEGALIGTGWSRPDTFTVGATLAARTETFKPLIAARPGYWHPANFAAATSTLDHLTGGRVLVNIVTGTDDPDAYGDTLTDRAGRYARTAEFLHVVRRLWTETSVTHHGRYYQLDDATLGIAPRGTEQRGHPTLYFGGASEEAERVAAAEADVQLFWGETYAAIHERIQRLKALSEELDRQHPPLEFGLRTTVVVRDTSEEAWEDARARVATMARNDAGHWRRTREKGRGQLGSVGQERLEALGAEDEVLDDVLYTAPSRVGGGGAGTTWLVGSYQEVANALEKYRSLGITHFVLSDTPYLREIPRVGDHVLPLLRAAESAQAAEHHSTTENTTVHSPTLVQGTL